MACFLAGLWALVCPRTATSQDHNFAGSLQTNYLWVPDQGEARAQAFDSFTNELALKVAVDFSPTLSANVKLCYGCHGLEVDMAFANLRVGDLLNIRLGRFNPSFGDFPARHDPANHRAADKPLPYDMGQMLRMRDYNLGVIPAPYVDQGLEVYGTHWFDDVAQLTYALYALSGLQAEQTGLDLNFSAGRAPYYTDNNSEPAIGGRLTLTFQSSADVIFTVGGSAMAGRADPGRDHAYHLVGSDLYLRLYALELHAEYLLRRTEFAVTANPDSRFRYGPDAAGQYADYFLKDGFYVEADLLPSRYLEFILRVDGLRRRGNVAISSPLQKRSTVMRYTLGANVLVESSVRIKLSGEFYRFSDFDNQAAGNLGVTAAF